MTTFTTLGPSRAATKMASRIEGKVSWTSASRMRSESAQPPKYPETRPAVTPIRPARTRVETPTVMETRAPCIIWARMSCPTWSVPKTAKLPSDKVEPGGLRRSLVRVATGSYSRTMGPNTAAKAYRAMIARHPRMRAGRRRAVAAPAARAAGSGGGGDEGSMAPGTGLPVISVMG